MTLSQNTSIAGLVLIVGLTVLNRRVLVSWTAIGVFWISHIVFICVGLLTIPWLSNQLGQGVFWEGLDFSLLSEEDWAKAIALTIGWMILVLSFYQLWGMLFRGGVTRTRANYTLPYSNPYGRSGFGKFRLLVLSFISLVIAYAYIAVNVDVFVEGVAFGFIGGDPGAVYTARRGSTQSYMFVQLAYNVVPFFAIALWVQYGLKGQRVEKVYSLAYVSLATILLVLVFQKRPLLIFLFAAGLAHLWMRRDEKYVRSAGISNNAKKLISLPRGLVYLSIVFATLVLLYLMQTQIGRSATSYFDAVQELSAVALVRIFGRMAIQPAMVVHYFPNVEDFYGFLNVGVFTSIIGVDSYAANAKVFEYFRGYGGGNIAMPTFLDLYGGFGVYGWLFGSFVIGFLLRSVDHFIRALRPSRANIVVTVFLFVFVYYLSQASVFRSMLGYGGVIFVFLWYSLVLRAGVPNKFAKK